MTTPPKAIPALSYSTAATLITQSPLHAWLDHYQLGGRRREPTPDMDMGTIIDSLILEGGKGLTVIDADSYRSKAAQELRDEARAARSTPILAHKLEEAKVIAQEVTKKIESFGLSLDGKSQLKVQWTEESSIGPVQCRGKLDHLRENAGEIYDLKKISCGDLRTCTRRIYDMGYDIQYASYTRWFELSHPELAGRSDFIFIFFETEPPYAVTPLRLDGPYRQLGQARWRRAVELWAKCLKTNNWPAYVDGIERASPPSWALSQELEAVL